MSWWRGLLSPVHVTIPTTLLGSAAEHRHPSILCTPQECLALIRSPKLLYPWFLLPCFSRTNPRPRNKRFWTTYFLGIALSLLIVVFMALNPAAALILLRIFWQSC